MLRPCFLVVDRESPNGISTRKLIIETAKFNVITAYSSHEAVETLVKFPAIDGVVLDAAMPDMPCEDLIYALKTVRADLPVIQIWTPRGNRSDNADYILETFDPRDLLTLLQKLHPLATSAIEKQNEDLENFLCNANEKSKE